MEAGKQLLIVVDAGHGGYDNGASYGGRVEKDDNLRLALAVRRELEAQGLGVLMTRDTDEFVALQERAAMANEADADLFVSLHRNSYIEQTASTNGVENFIYLTAPEATSGRAAQLVLDGVAAAGVQSNRGVKRGNYYVLRRTAMPAMLLETGYIINDEDNRLYDEKLDDYARGITRGVMEYFGLTYQEGADGPEEPAVPASACCQYTGVSTAQQAMNSRYGAGLEVTGVFDDATRRAVTKELQTELNRFGAGLAVDGVYGPLTRAAVPAVGFGSRGNLPYLVQVLLLLNNYFPGPVDGIFGAGTRSGVLLFQKDRLLSPDGVAGPATVSRLIGWE